MMISDNFCCRRQHIPCLIRFWSMVVFGMDSFAGLLMWLLFALFTCGSSKKPITCDAGQFAAGQTASVTCNFPHKINYKGYRIFVLHYPFSAPPDFSGDEVLKCSHLHRQKPYCKVAEGYHLNNVITNPVKLRIPEVKQDFAGRYVCQIVPPDGRPMNACNLTVDGTTFTSTTADTTQPDTYSIPLNIPWLGLNVGMSLVVVTLLCSLAYITIRMRKLERRHREYHKNREQPQHTCSYIALKKVTVVGDTQTDDCGANP